VDLTPVTSLELFEEPELWATSTGNVITSGGRPIFAFIGKQARELANHRARLTLGVLRERLGELLGIAGDRSVPHYRNLRPVKSEERTYARYSVETEGNIRAIMCKRMADPQQARSLDVASCVHLYLPHLRAEEDLANDTLALELQEKYELYALDVRGLGESVPQGHEVDSFWYGYGLDYLIQGHELLLGRSYLGRRVFDVLRTIELLASKGAEKIYLYGRGQGALLALFTAILDPRVTSVTLQHSPRSYQEWATEPLVDWPAANCVRRVLHHFDLEDCVRVLGNSVQIASEWDARMCDARVKLPSESPQ
jgi:hypothetical protein